MRFFVLLIAGTLLAISPSTWGAGADELFLQSADGNFKLVPKLRLQLQHRVQLIENLPNTNDFFLRRGRFGVEGHAFTKDLEYELEFDVGTPDPGNAQFDLKDYFLDYRALPLLHIRTGQFKTPFGMQEFLSSKKLQFVERALASEEFTHGRDIGLMLWGPDKYDPLVYYVGAFNGDRDNNFNSNAALGYFARFLIQPFGKYKDDESDLEGTKEFRASFGGQFFQNRDNTAGDQLFVGGGFAGLKYAGFSFRGEYFRRWNKNNVSTAARDLDGWGYYAQAGWFFLPERLEIALRGSEVRRRGADNDEWEGSTVFNYFFKGQNIKLQADYTFLMDENAIAGANDQWRHIVRTQLQFAI